MGGLQKGHFFNLVSVITMAVGPLLSKFGLLEISPAQASVINTITVYHCKLSIGSNTT
ncbi:hypothetical protein [Paraliobacillus zengyii]|uniref:hypothetical protein n=1 Tax=Paraliobacillus zengyii TaxID=2213194 RepID=UPI001F546C9B|nr:hypothetical protein [Paraliobacillus zengyii]